MPPYCPQFQPIELAWSLIKHKFKKGILRAMLEEVKQCEVKDLIESSIQGLDQNVLKKQFKHSLELLLTKDSI